MCRKLQILLVDDETAITDNLSPFLERSGFQVTVSINGKDACSVPGSSFGPALVRAMVTRHGDKAAIRSRPNQSAKMTLRLSVDGG